MSDEWIGAAEALSMVESVMGSYNGNVAITTRAHDGLIQARAERFIVNSNEAKIDADLPKQFWWACGEAALEQNWISGDFSTWINDSHLRAYGVKFYRSEIEKLLPNQQPETANNKELWLPIREAVLMVSRTTMQGHTNVLMSFIAYCKVNQMKGRAADIREIVKDTYGDKEHVYTDKNIPHWFWKDCIKNERFDLDWQLGILKGARFVDGKRSEVQLLGVEFEAQGLISLAPNLKSQIESLYELKNNTASLSQIPESTFDASQNAGKGGRPLSKLWPDWVAELALYIHEEGIPHGEGQQGQEDLIKAVADRLMARGSEAPSRTTVQPVIQAVLARLRAAGN